MFSDFRWVYLRKKSAEGPFHLYSDKESRINHYKRILRFLLPLAILNFVFGLGLLLNRLENLGNLVVALILAIPSWSYYQRIVQLEKEGKIRE
ncbi:MAG: DUF2812 domain-containing protein [Firmicutes bacterium]|nr:DUF2812 domain-containing protein [Bacillota bacterium]